MKQINEKLGQSKYHPNYVLNAEYEKHNHYHRNVLEGMTLLIYLKERKNSEKFLEKFGLKLKAYITDFIRMYPEKKVIIENLKIKFKSIYGTTYKKF